MKYTVTPLLIALIISSCTSPKNQPENSPSSGNPIFPGWYADPEGIVLNNEYWVFPTYSAKYEEQVFFDAFSSQDLITWKKHERILDTSMVKWAKQALWAPSMIEKHGKYFLFFSANDVQKPGGPYWDENNTINHHGGIGIAVADSPSGPFSDHLGKPLIGEFHNDAQPIDQSVFKDNDGTYYLLYGGWRHCNLAVLNEDFTGFIPWSDGTLFKEITPEGYVEGPFMFRRNDMYYFMWSEGSWGDDTYKVAYAMAEKATGPFERIGTILQLDRNIATGAGHNSVMHARGTKNGGTAESPSPSFGDRRRRNRLRKASAVEDGGTEEPPSREAAVVQDSWYIVYHRRPIPNEGRDHRVTCIDTLEFNEDGTIRQVKMTFEGVRRRG